MTVRVITDSSAGLPPELAEQLSITVIDLHLMESHGKDGLERSTSGLSALELAAAYGREMERAQDCLLYTSPSPRDVEESRMPSSA